MFLIALLRCSGSRQNAKFTIGFLYDGHWVDPVSGLFYCTLRIMSLLSISSSSALTLSHRAAGMILGGFSVLFLLLNPLWCGSWLVHKAGLSFSVGDWWFSPPVNNYIAGNSDFQHQMILDNFTKLYLHPILKTLPKLQELYILYGVQDHRIHLVLFKIPSFARVISYTIDNKLLSSWEKYASFIALIHSFLVHSILQISWVQVPCQFSCYLHLHPTLVDILYTCIASLLITFSRGALMLYFPFHWFPLLFCYLCISAWISLLRYFHCSNWVVLHGSGKPWFIAILDLCCFVLAEVAFLMRLLWILWTVICLAALRSESFLT